MTSNDRRFSVTITDDFLAQRGSPLPYCKTNNVIGTLNEYLQKQGETPAEIIVTSHSQTRYRIQILVYYMHVLDSCCCRLDKKLDSY